MIFESTSIKSLLENIEKDLGQGDNLSLKVCAFLSDLETFDLFSTDKIRRVKSEAKIDKNEFMIKFDYTLIGNLGETEKASGIYFRHPNFDNVFLYVSFDPMFIFKRVIANYFNRFRPKVSQVFLTSSQIKMLIADASNLLGTDALVSRVVVKQEYPNGEVDVKYKQKKVKYKQAFIEAENASSTVSSLNVFIKNLDAYISKDGYFVLNKGTFKEFNSAILNGAINLLESSKSIYSNRERRSENSFRSAPLTIRFEEDVFNSIDDITNFINRVFDPIEKSFYSISHLNPYLQMSFTDFEDGSSFEIWVTKKNEVFIVPQFRATFYSITKIIRNVFGNFVEGNVIDSETNKIVEQNERV
ncbi:MAG: hypothetical protein KGH94_03945 [Candidatus Micrarchaeota archaeon]|nr:hypothetical protein [Candidatus Micrarchaeota archaeon]